MKTKVLYVPDQKNETLAIHNALIRGNYKYSMAELRFILTVVSMIKRTDEEFATYQLGAKDFSDLIDSKFKDEYSRIKKLGTDLMSKPIILENLEKREFKIRSWFSKFDYKAGTIHCSFDNDLKPYLLSLGGQFTLLGLENFLRMKSRYGMLLYMIAKSWEAKGYFDITVEDFKELLSVKTKAYDRYNNLKNKVLDAACNEINKLTSMNITYEEIKDGRKVTKLKFLIRRGDGSALPKKGLKDKNLDFEISDLTRELVDLFIQSRKKIQPDFDINLSSGGKDPYVTMQKHMNDGMRTNNQYLKMIEWVFASPKASFWRSRILTIDSLIKNYGAVELASMEEAQQDGDIKVKIETRVALMKKRNESDEEIAAEVRKMVDEHTAKRKSGQQLSLDI